jgi:hypothetical protein
MIESTSDSSTREGALQFLDELEVRHDFLLTELEKLNVTIETVLNEYTKSRQIAAPQLVPAVATPLASTSGVDGVPQPVEEQDE